MLILTQPVWLLLLLPLAALLLFRRLPNRLLLILRATAVTILVVAMCDPAIRLPDRSGSIIVVADRSESMPANSVAAQSEIIGLLQKSMGPRDLLGIVSFGREAIVERAPQKGEFGGFTGKVGIEHSDLNEALATGLALIPPDAGGRLLVLSDGKWTGIDPESAAARATGRRIAIDYRSIARPLANELAIQTLQTPESVFPEQSFVIGAWSHSPIEQQIEYQLSRGGGVIAAGSKIVPSGLSRLLFRDRAGSAGVNEYQVKISGPKDDPVPENNTARALVGVKGPRPVLHLSEAGAGSGLARLLGSSGLAIVPRKPSEVPWSLEELAKYSAVIVENLPANQVGNAALESLAVWVEQTGSGLMLTGGQKSYGPGGYFKSPIDRILPVSMELRKEHRKLSLAIVVALDRSGSMSVPVGNGKLKIDLADMGAVQVLDLMSPVDEIGVLAVDTEPHVMLALDTVQRNSLERDRILSIASAGGGINVFEALVGASEMIQQAKAQTRHIILFADANDSRQHPGDYAGILANCRAADITVSVIGLGKETDRDADILIDVAKLGGGTCYFTDDPEQLPQLFAQDTFTVARSTFIDEPTEFSFTAGLSLLGSWNGGEPPSIGGYNLCYVKPTANLAAVTKDEFQAPVVASWNAGSGRVLSLTCEADGRFSGSLANWPSVGDFYSTLTHWISGDQKPLPDDMLLTQEVRDGFCFLRLYLSPRRAGDSFTTSPKVNVLQGIPGAIPSKSTVALEWKTADMLEAAIPINGRETVLNTVQIPGQSPVSLSPVCAPYSAEFAPNVSSGGRTTLAKLALTTGGKERLEIPSMWKDLPSTPRFVTIAPGFIVLGMLMFLAEILERRTGLVARFTTRRAHPLPKAAIPSADISEEAAVLPPTKRSVTASVQPANMGPAPQPEPAKKPTAPAPHSASAADTSLDTLREARKRADKRHRDKSAGK